MPSPEESSYWTKDDAVKAREIFRTSTWTKMLEILKVKGPKLIIGPSEQVAMTAHRKDAWENCLNSFTRFGAELPDEEEFDQIDTSSMTSKKVK